MQIQSFGVRKSQTNLKSELRSDNARNTCLKKPC